MCKLNQLLFSLVILLMSSFTPLFAGYLYLSPTLFLQDNTTRSSNYRGLHPRLTVGYAENFDHDFYLALEAYGVPATATLADNHNNGAVSARSNRSVGLNLVPGSNITENLLGYAIVGIVNTNFPSPNTSRAGGQVGVGMLSCLTPYWDLRVEYIYSAYRTVPTLGSVKSDQVGLGLIYKVIS